MLNQGMIPVNNDNILHQLILGKTKFGEVIEDWTNQDWNGICWQCGTIIESFQNIFEGNKVKKYYSDLSTHLGVHRITGIRTLIRDHYLWHNVKDRQKLLAQFAISSLIIAEICVERLTGELTR